MIFTMLQIALLASVALYFGYLRAALHRRNRQSWDSLIARLRPDWSARELSDHFLWKEGLNATPEEIWNRLPGVRGLWAMYQNAGIMLEMADFAARHCANIDQSLIETLRSDASQIRICAVTTLIQYGLNQTSEIVRINAFHAASMYTGMAARMTQLLQDNAATALPDFVAAM
jgi:hypothetical protein